MKRLVLLLSLLLISCSSNPPIQIPPTPKFPEVPEKILVRCPDLEKLQDRIPPFGRAAAVKEIEESFGKPLDALYSEFSEPIAAASIAQVHRARTLSGETVAVKVLRPGVRTRFRRDLAAMAYAAGVMEEFSSEARRLKFVDVVETLKRSVTMEMDLRLEAAALSEMAENAREDVSSATRRKTQNDAQRLHRKLLSNRRPEAQ